MPVLGLIPGDPRTTPGGDLRAASKTSWHTISQIPGAAMAVGGVCELLRFDPFTILLDGRIDNCAELREKLGTEDASPAALMLGAYTRWRDDFPTHILGDYAFAVWDGLDCRLLLGRDTSGSRPLHYGFRGSEFVFASEARALLALPGMRMAPDEEKVASWLAFAGNRTSSTFFQGISAVLPGQTVLFENGRVTTASFWEPLTIPLLRLKDAREYDEGLRGVLRQAVRDRITPGKRIGSHLSGGLDSSSVTATAAALLAERGERLTAFTAVPAVELDGSLFTGRFGDELPHAAAVARLYPNIDHVPVSNHAEPMFAALDRANSATERPQLNPMNTIWMDAINLQARQLGLDVVLDGVLGNVTISYDGTRALPMLLRDGRVVAAARLAREMHRQGQRSLWVANRAFRPFLPGFIRRAIDGLRGQSSFPAADATGASHEFLRAHGHMPHDFPFTDHIFDGRAYRVCIKESRDRGMYAAAAVRLYGIEMSDPTADRRVLEFCLSIPEEQFCRGGIPRSLVRDAMAGQLPEAVLKERDKGLQAADSFHHLTAERAEFARELDLMQQSELLTRALDLPALKAQVARWPARLANRQEWFEYCLGLTRAISIGRFVRRMEDGSLWGGIG